jgi:DNA replication protein DnaD
LSKVETEVIKTEVETISTIKTEDTDVYEVEVVAKDSLQPITINLNGTTQTFSGASKVVLRKKKEALKTQETKSVESNEKRTESAEEKKEVVTRDVSRNGIKFLIPLAFLVGLGYLAYRFARRSLII